MCDVLFPGCEEVASPPGPVAQELLSFILSYANVAGYATIYQNLKTNFDFE